MLCDNKNTLELSNWKLNLIIVKQGKTNRPSNGLSLFRRKREIKITHTHLGDV